MELSTRTAYWSTLVLLLAIGGFLIASQDLAALTDETGRLRDWLFWAGGAALGASTLIMLPAHILLVRRIRYRIGESGQRFLWRVLVRMLIALSVVAAICLAGLAWATAGQITSGDGVVAFASAPIFWGLALVAGAFGGAMQAWYARWPDGGVPVLRAWGGQYVALAPPQRRSAEDER